MHVTIDLSEQDAAALEARARPAQMPPERYLRKIVAQALDDEQPAEQRLKPKKSSYGLLAQYGSGPTEEEIDESRREMLSGFGE
jgi:hypothetical protein